MKLLPVAQNLKEWIALKADMVPIPLAHTHICFMLARAVLEAHSLNVFEAFKDGPLTIGEAAGKTKLNQRALKSLLNVLISTSYFTFSANKYKLTSHARKWCLQESKFSLHNQQLFNKVCWEWMEHLPEFLKTGNGLQYHDKLSAAEWEIYMKGMEGVAMNSAKDAVRMAPVLKNPLKMLDIGGSHGLYTYEFCEKYPSLKGVIFDLPSAVEKAQPLLQKRFPGNRIRYVRGNALTEDLGTEEYDLVFISSLMHHFTEEENKLLCYKVAKALRKGGYFIIQEFIRPEPSGNMEMVGSILDLFFNLSSTSGNWSEAELKNFQVNSGLVFHRTKNFLSPPGFSQLTARK